MTACLARYVAALCFLAGFGCLYAIVWLGR